MGGIREDSSFFLIDGIFGDEMDKGRNNVIVDFLKVVFRVGVEYRYIK